jgi:hypothetical protein
MAVRINGQYVLSRLTGFPDKSVMSPIRSKLFRFRYTGIRIVVGGTRIVRMTPANSQLLPLNFSLANP